MLLTMMTYADDDHDVKRHDDVIDCTRHWSRDTDHRCRSATRRRLLRSVYDASVHCTIYYIPFIHSRHNAKDRSLGVGRDI